MSDRARAIRHARKMLRRGKCNPDQADKAWASIWETSWAAPTGIKVTRTYREFTSQFADHFIYFRECDAGTDEDGRQLMDVLVYNSEEALEADTDNSLSVARATVIDDRA
jgi:hypothetical protein